MSRPAGGLSRFLLPIVAGAMVGVALACLLVPIRWDDQSFYIYAAPRLLDGYRLYSPDLQDTNPPLIAWLTMVPALLARATGMAPDASFVACLVLLTGVVILWSLRLHAGSDRVRSTWFAPWLAVILIYATIVLPSVAWKLAEARAALGMALRYDFGQREHIMALLVLPYLFAAARRLAARRLPVLEAIVIGLAAAIGFSIKPQYLTVVAGVEALLVFRAGGLRSLFRPELVALIFGGLAYCVAVWFLTPDYLTTVIPTVATIYGDFSHKTAWEIMTTSKYNFAVLAAAAAALVAQRGSGVTHLTATFLVAGVCAFASFILQGKGWSDHLFPAEMFIIVALAAAFVGHLLQWTNRRGHPFGGRVVASVVAVACCLAVFAFYYPARAGLWAKSDYAKQITETEEATATLPPGTAFVVLADGIYTQFDIATDRGFVWASRYPFLLLPKTVIEGTRESTGAQEQAASAQARHYFMVSDVLQALNRKPVAPGQYVQMLRAQVVEDFRRWQPEIVLAQRCADPQTEPCIYGQGFKVAEWLSADPAFASIWSHYKYVRKIDRFDLYELAR